MLAYCNATVIEKSSCGHQDVSAARRSAVSDAATVHRWRSAGLTLTRYGINNAVCNKCGRKYKIDSDVCHLTLQNCAKLVRCDPEMLCWRGESLWYVQREAKGG
mmetsp:Transcript_44382/g.73629  ORF Transcript_44382/g.73629 Transcript_44382/m.73629 type:complete len:104 (+) Transcript_44382:418-729(+)